MVGEKRAALAPLFPARTEHEVIDDQLAAAAEKVRERLAAFRAFEHIVLLHSYPRQLAPLTAELIALPSVRFFGRQVCFTRLEPFFSGYDIVAYFCCSHGFT